MSTWISAGRHFPGLVQTGDAIALIGVPVGEGSHSSDACTGEDRDIFSATPFPSRSVQ
jgi:hypothetical protein